MNALASYFSSLIQAISQGWNRFWFTAVDPFTVCLLRLLAGAVAFYYVFSFTFDLNLWFGPEGLLPVETVRLFTSGDGRQLVVRPSYLNYVDSTGFLYAVHGLGILATLSLLVGFFTRLSSVLCLLVVLSYVHRAPFIAGLVEPVLCMLLLYLCIAPAGACLSVDRWLASRRQSYDDGQLSKSLAANISQRLMQVHLSGLYLMFALTKLEGPTWWQGEAVWWLIARPESRIVDLTWLAGHSYVLNFWTHLIVLFELSFAVLVWGRWSRPLLLLLAIPVWVSTALITGELAFAAVMLAANLAFVRPQVLRDLLGFQAPLPSESVAGANA